MEDILQEYRQIATDLGEAGVTEQLSRVSLNTRDASMPISLSFLERRKIETIIQLLDDAEFLEAVRSGKVTFGLIKPHAHKAKLQADTDTAVRDKIITAIQPPLEVMVAQDFLLPRHEAEEFYRHHRERPDVFPRLMEFMTSGAVTGLILFDKDGNAVQNWREQMGPTDPVKAEPHHLRHVFARQIENNVLHGASSLEGVEAELRMFRRLLAPYCSV